MKKQYTYKLRPGYESEELLIEFGPLKNSRLFMVELLDLLTHYGFKLESVEELWVNDEVLYFLSSGNGKIMISLDIWDLVFIMSKENQKDILEIDKILTNSGLFEKEEVDFSRYKRRYS